MAGQWGVEREILLVLSRDFTELQCLIYLYFNFIAIQLIYNVVLVSAVQQSQSVTHVHIFTFLKRFYSHVDHRKVLNSSCAIQ